MPNSSITTRRNILSLSDSVYKRTVLNFHLPEEFFGRNDKDELFVGAYATVIDPLSLIAEQLLLIDDVNLLHLEPLINVDDDGDRIITGPASGEAFQK